MWVISPERALWHRVVYVTAPGHWPDAGRRHGDAWGRPRRRVRMRKCWLSSRRVVRVATHARHDTHARVKQLQPPGHVTFGSPGRYFVSSDYHWRRCHRPSPLHPRGLYTSLTNWIFGNRIDSSSAEYGGGGGRSFTLCGKFHSETFNFGNPLILDTYLY